MNNNWNNTCDNKNKHPYIANIHQCTVENNNFRIALWTGEHIQMTLMCIQPYEELGFEVHENLDQFIRIEKGQALFKAGECMHHITYQKILQIFYNLLHLSNYNQYIAKSNTIRSVGFFSLFI